MSKIYRIPVVWQMMGYEDVEAESMKEAITKLFEDDAVYMNRPLPEGDYLDESYKVDKEGLEEYYEEIKSLPEEYFG